MNKLVASLEVFAFGILPYVAVVTFFLVSIYRYRSRPFTYTSLSSQFLENRSHFWALVPFHYGILFVLAGHLLALLVPRSILAWNSVPIRLYLLEITGLAFGLLTLIGLVAAIVRRGTTPHLRIVTSPVDWVLHGLLLIQVVTGVGVAVLHPWGSSWFAAAMTPYLRSLLGFSPNSDFISALPWLVKAHVLNAWLLIWLFPFTRLAHVLVVPNPYLWRRPQVARWNRTAVSKPLG